jgi:hypothetical protein
MKRGTFFTALIISMVIGGTAWAQEAEVANDSLHPSKGLSAVTAAVPDNNSWGADPFNNPLAAKPIDLGPGDQEQQEPESELSDLGLTGIIFNNNMRLAIIDGNTMSVGSQVGDWRLVQILSRSVVFMDAAGDREEIFLNDHIDRKDHNVHKVRNARNVHYTGRKKKYSQLSMNTDLRGRYNELGEYFRQLEAMTKIVNIRKVRIESCPDSNSVCSAQIEAVTTYTK